MASYHSSNDVIEAMTPEQLLQANNMLLDPAELQTVLDAAMRSGEVLEIWLDRDKRTFTSRLFNPPEGVKPGVDCLWITPLEPSSGNIAIRQAQQIRFLFHLGQYAAGGTTQFKRVENVGPTRVLTIAFPSLLRIHLQRSNARYLIPRDRPCLVRASRRREMVLNGILLDVNLQGLGFEIANPDLGFDIGEALSVEIQPSSFAMQPFRVFGTVCFKSRVRDMDSVLDRYGVMFAQEGQYMMLRQLVEKLRRMGLSACTPQAGTGG